MEQEIDRFEREMKPSLAKANTAVARPIKKISSEQSAQVSQDFRLAGRMKPVAAIIDGETIHLEAAGVSADMVALLQDDGLGFAVACQLPSRPQACRSSA
jgi:hypothetical protein